ncbi:MAG: IS66 family transposase [Bacteriovoracaceae bacterium]
MALDDLKKLTTGFIKGWKKGKLKETLKETAELAIEEKIKNSELEEKNRQLQDEIRRLKGEKKKPKIKAANTKELNPKPKKPRSKKEKKKELEVDEEVEVDVDQDILPKDAKFIGTRAIVVQEMVIKRRNIKFKIKRYYSKELKKTYEGEVPQEFKGREFGPQLVSFILYQYYKNRVPHKKIIEMLFDFGIEMSAGTVCSILNNLKDEFSVDLKSARDAGLRRSTRLHIDDTGAKVSGANAYTFGVSNKYFTQYTTSFEKNRWAATGALLYGEQKFLIDKDAVEFVAKKLKKPYITVFFNNLKGSEVLKRTDLEQVLEDPIFEKVTKAQKDIIRTACAISALRNGDNGPPIRFLVSDDGTNFVDLIKNHQLCWVHEIRNYKLSEVFKRIEFETLDKLVDTWRSFYKLMKNYKNNPSATLRVKIRSEFDRITSLKTGVKQLDAQLGRTRKKVDKLLLFLKYPQLPLHNNLCENDLRERVIKRKISLQNRSTAGVKAWDLMLSLSSTCRKLRLSFWRYLEDRTSGREAIPYLGKVVRSL